jgi:hypothetical protein
MVRFLRLITGIMGSRGSCLRLSNSVSGSYPAGGGTELATLRGRSLITEDGEAIEGEALDDVTVIGVVTFTICDVRQDNAVV